MEFIMDLIASHGSKPVDELQAVDSNGKNDVNASFVRRLLATLVGRGLALVRWRPAALSLPGRATGADTDLVGLGDMLLSRRGEASGVAIAKRLLRAYTRANEDSRIQFLRSLAVRFGPDLEKVKAAANVFLSAGTPEAAQALHVAAEPRRQELFRRLNLAPDGTAALIRMREELLSHINAGSGLEAVDADILHLFTAWFNRGFLLSRPIDWTTPAHILEKIIRYEAVHQIQDWQDLRRRIEPSDRRCFAFFHPCLLDEPLIFVEVALTRDVPAAIGPLLAAEREPMPATEATTAVFYSISNCQVGLRGISFGNFLIKQVAEELKKSLPSISRFVTLSPVPGFSRWLDKERQSVESTAFSPEDREKLKALDEPEWFASQEQLDALRGPLLRSAAYYFLYAKALIGRPLDPVARFHLGNGARLDRLNLLGDTSQRGIKQSKGLMVNYLYDLKVVEKNHELYADTGEVVASPIVRRLLAHDAA
jgi:malonyl-CoA decarboxylase